MHWHCLQESLTRKRIDPVFIAVVRSSQKVLKIKTA